jgi:hypothetical protein
MEEDLVGTKTQMGGEYRVRGKGLGLKMKDAVRKYGYTEEDLEGDRDKRGI